MAFRSDPTSHYRKIFSDIEPGGRLMIFGRPSFLYEGAPEPEPFFKQFGFAEVHTLDISPYQGASHIFDLNSAEPPADLVSRYRFVMSGGTLEHVFNIANAVRTAVALVETGGTLSFGGPCNNWVDHGFYQISPTFAFDYFTENGLEFSTSVAHLQDPRTFDLLSIPLYPGESIRLNYRNRRASYNARLIRTPGSTFDRIPKQGTYQSMHEGAQHQFRFRAFVPTEIVGGMPKPIPLKTFPLDAKAIRQEGHRYWHPFRSTDYLASLPGRPFRSSGIVYEDDEPLPWIVSDPAMVDQRPGSFTHFKGIVHFTATDGSDPRNNGRRYTIRFPVHPLLQTAARKQSAEEAA